MEVMLFNSSELTLISFGKVLCTLIKKFSVDCSNLQLQVVIYNQVQVGLYIIGVQVSKSYILCYCSPFLIWHIWSRKKVSYYPNVILLRFFKKMIYYIVKYHFVHKYERTFLFKNYVHNVTQFVLMMMSSSYHTLQK